MIISQASLIRPQAAVACKLILLSSICSVIFFFFVAPLLSSIDVVGPIFDRHLITQSQKTSPLPELISHGKSRCLPSITDDLIEESDAWKESCHDFAPFKPSRSRVGRVMLAYGEMKEHYRRALRTHVLHSMIHNSTLNILCDTMADEWNLWNKPAYILTLLLEQMTLPPEERLEWLMWLDLDTIVLDQCRPVSSFLPPSSTDLDEWDNLQIKGHFAKRKGLNKRGDHSYDHINLITTKDGNGLNNGIFFLRVSPWAIELFENILSYRFYKPEEKLSFGDQSAMEKVLEDPQFAPKTVYVPWKWFNAYPNSDLGPEMFKDSQDQSGLEDFQVRRGDFLVHFAGPWGKDEPMTEWLNITEVMGNVWEEDQVQRDISGEIKKFWEEREYDS